MKSKICKIILGILLLSSTSFATEKEVVIPIDAKLEYNSALDLYKLGKYEEAISCLRTAIRLYPDFIDAYYNLGSILDYLNQSDKAISILKQIMVRKPDDYETAYKIASIAAKHGNNKIASEYASIIPATSDFYIEAKQLMEQYNLTKTERPEAQNSNIPQESSVYLNVNSPTGIATDSQGNVYVASFNDNAIIKITPDGKRMIFFKNSMLKGPVSITIDSKSNMFIANYNADNVIRVSNSGVAEVFIAQIKKPYSVHVAAGMLFVSAQGDNSIVRKRIP